MYLCTLFAVFFLFFSNFFSLSSSSYPLRLLANLLEIPFWATRTTPETWSVGNPCFNKSADKVDGREIPESEHETQS